MRFVIPRLLYVRVSLLDYCVKKSIVLRLSGERDVTCCTTVVRFAGNDCCPLFQMPHSSSSRDCSVGASGPRLRPVQTIPLQSSTSPGGLCWSAGSGGTLAVATRKGALAIEMVPGARGATEEAAAPAADVGCNLDMVMVTRCLDEQNPYLQDVGVDRYVKG